jgi:hypothetical protein
MDLSLLSLSIPITQQIQHQEKDRVTATDAATFRLFVPAHLVQHQFWQTFTLIQKRARGS